MQNQLPVETAATFLRERLSLDGQQVVGVVLGTGLGAWAESLGGARIPYAEIPGFPTSTVEGHAGELITGELAGKCVLALSGRFHLYEGYDPGQAVMGVRTLIRAGAGAIILSNAAGALNPQFDTGTLMAITDHINFTGTTPLTGTNVETWGERFPDMSRVWDPELVRLGLDCATDLDLRLERGVYVQVPGPNLETPAETRAYRMLGADAVGMSTVLEAIAAVHMGARVAGFSCLTNKNLPDCMAPTSLEDVLSQARAAARHLGRLLSCLIERM